MNHILFDGQKVFPSKLVCVGRNYVDHIKELGNDLPDEMVVFNKPNSAIASSLNSFHLEPLHYETELCFIYQGGSFSGVGLGLDLTKRELQSQLKAKGLPWERAKSFDGSAVFTSFVAISHVSQALRFTLHIDGNLIQAGDVNLMIYSPDAIIDEIGQFMTLTDGDVIMTGTPKGVGVITAGSVFELTLFDDDKKLVQQSFVAQ